jgi:hypothetical protein
MQIVDVHLDRKAPHPSCVVELASEQDFHAALLLNDYVRLGSSVQLLMRRLPRSCEPARIIDQTLTFPWWVCSRIMAGGWWWPPSRKVPAHAPEPALAWPSNGVPERMLMGNTRALIPTHHRCLAAALPRPSLRQVMACCIKADALRAAAALSDARH